MKQFGTMRHLQDDKVARTGKVLDIHVHTLHNRSGLGTDKLN